MVFLIFVLLQKSKTAIFRIPCAKSSDDHFSDLGDLDDLDGDSDSSIDATLEAEIAAELGEDWNGIWLGCILFQCICWIVLKM